MLSFKDFMTVDYKPGMPELVSYAAHKRRRGRIGEDTETTDEALSFQSRQAKSRAMKKNKAKIQEECIKAFQFFSIKLIQHLFSFLFLDNYQF